MKTREQQRKPDAFQRESTVFLKQRKGTIVHIFVPMHDALAVASGQFRKVAACHKKSEGNRDKLPARIEVPKREVGAIQAKSDKLRVALASRQDKLRRLLVLASQSGVSAAFHPLHK